MRACPRARPFSFRACCAALMLVHMAVGGGLRKCDEDAMLDDAIDVALEGRHPDALTQPVCQTKPDGQQCRDAIREEQGRAYLAGYDLHNQNEQYDATIKFLQSAGSPGSRTHYAWMMAAVCLERLALYCQAKRCYEEAIASAPPAYGAGREAEFLAEALRNMATIQRIMQDINGAAVNFERSDLMYAASEAGLEDHPA